MVLLTFFLKCSLLHLLIFLLKCNNNLVKALSCPVLQIQYNTTIIIIKVSIETERGDRTRMKWFVQQLNIC